MSDELDRSHVTEYVAPEGPVDSTSSELTDKSHIPNYVSPKGPKDPGGMSRDHVNEYVAPKGPKDPGGMSRGHIKVLYVTPLPEPEDEPEPTPEELAKARRDQELREHEELVRRLQEEDRRKIAEERAAKSVAPTSTEGQD